MNSSLKRFLHHTRRLLPSGVRKSLFRGALFFGGDEAFPTIYSTLCYLKEWGFKPRKVVDVGAFEGEWTKMFKEIYPTAEILMVEPQESKAEKLAKVAARFSPDVPYQPVLLGAGDDQEVIFVEMETGSSVFEEQRTDKHHKERKTKTTVALDTLLRSTCGWDSVDLIKLDVQGYELEVLKGGAWSLAHAEVVVMEASLIPVNKGCPTIEAVLSFMYDQGFGLLDICEMHRRKDKSLWQVDLAFVAQTSRLMPESTLNEKNWY